MRSLLPSQPPALSSSSGAKDCVSAEFPPKVFQNKRKGNNVNIPSDIDKSDLEMYQQDLQHVPKCTILHAYILFGSAIYCWISPDDFRQLLGPSPDNIRCMLWTFPHKILDLFGTFPDMFPYLLDLVQHSRLVWGFSMKKIATGPGLFRTTLLNR